MTNPNSLLKLAEAQESNVYCKGYFWFKAYMNYGNAWLFWLYKNEFYHAEDSHHPSRP